MQGFTPRSQNSQITILLQYFVKIKDRLIILRGFNATFITIPVILLWPVLSTGESISHSSNQTLDH
jgi:hypothetical protein